MKKNIVRLGVNIDHVATIRNARGGIHPCPIRVAMLAEKYGADGITVHLREDRRHIKDKDLIELKNKIKLPLNLEMAPTKEMLNIALKTMPHAVCIVPEKRKEITTEGGLDIIKNKKILQYIIPKIKAKNIRVSLFIDANKNQIIEAKKIGADIVEIHTGEFCKTRGVQQQKEFKKIKESVILADSIGLEVHAGHGLNYITTKKIIKIKQIKELNIGHFIIGESLFDGIANVIKKMKSLLQ